MTQEQGTPKAAEKILLIEDDFAIRNSIEFALRREGFEVKVLDSGQEALTAVHSFNPDLILLDIMLPIKDGHEICEEIRQTGNTAAIIMVSALGETSDRIAGLRLGADDYVSKPFSLDELLERVRANLRRSSRERNKAQKAQSLAPAEMRFVFPQDDKDGNGNKGANSKELVIDPAKHEVRINGEKVSLRAKEFALLHILASRPQEVLTREELAKKIWEQDHMQSSRTIDVHIRRLRTVLSECDASDYLRTIHGVGYRFEADAKPDNT